MLLSSGRVSGGLLVGVRVCPGSSVVIVPWGAPPRAWWLHYEGEGCPLHTNGWSVLLGGCYLAALAGRSAGRESLLAVTARSVCRVIRGPKPSRHREADCTVENVAMRWQNDSRCCDDGIDTAATVKLR
ncbi:hypothetical protein IF1G_10427 [Cordyceps javanica]|uniref:Uncharacterized protein n=1 Tax=Cordyceps javanica TaxID=43265 RepID=A0A545UN61_9HYPO|nr:hypothetical protein IF1G_10427 [Cordyceps javanica]